MHFQRLRLAGFKSFVEPADFRIEPGLTGVVGPNGCGKSNLLEALRWVMGASSAKAMRAGGMDDVIFGGAGSRPPRNHAEVTLTIDNSDRRAPPAFNDHPVLEVARRIDRGAGSTYRLNGREVRARDVQLLFADASTGANSPALVRQGQISELIAAKPQNRRRILEEAAGVGGLHARRHEAELRLRAAEANLERLDDVARELESGLSRLKREARQAEKYKRLSAEIRALQGAVRLARWTEAARALDAAEGEAQAQALQVEATARAAAAASAAALAAQEALTPLREEEAIAAAVLQRVLLEKDRIDHQVAAARAEVDRLKADLARMDADAAREGQIVEDAAGVLRRLDNDLAQVERQIAAAPQRLPDLQAQLAAADAERAHADAAVEQLAAEAAADQARRHAAAQRLADAEARLARAERALAGAGAELASLPKAPEGEAEGAAERLARAEAALAAARETLETSEAERAEAAGLEGAAREAARQAEDRLGRLKVEARGLAQLLLPPMGAAYPPALDRVSVDAGYEAALAAALGDDLSAALDVRAPAHWAGADVPPPPWPDGVQPLAARVRAPPEMAARLAHVGVVARDAGGALQAALPVGARLVSREGDLWRWDGFTARAEAPRPAALRLAQKARLNELEAEIDGLAPAAAQAAAALTAAQTRLRAAEAAIGPARRATPEAERAVQAARETVGRLAAVASTREARAAALNDTAARLAAERDEAAQALAIVRAEQPTGADGEGGAKLAAARAAAGAARDRASAARGAFDLEKRDSEGRLRRRDAIVRERSDWARRAEAAERRTGELAASRGRAVDALAAAQAAPAEAEAKAERLIDELRLAERRRTHAADAYAAADSARAAADREARAADAAAAAAREARAATDARAEGARARAEEELNRLREATGLEPDALARRLAETATAVPAEAEGVEAHLAALEREREALGAVNLVAEEQAGEQSDRLESMRRERADLSGAVAKLRESIDALNAEGRERLLAAFEVVNGHFQSLFETLFGGGHAELKLIESDDPLEAGLEIYACPPGKRLAAMSLMSGGEQALTAAALIFGVFLAAPAPVCVLDEVDAPLDDANVDRFCNLLDEMRRRTETRFIIITHNAVTMSRMDRLFGVTMAERGVSQLVSVDLRQAEALAAE
jgi:chromosome segregation protein